MKDLSNLEQVGEGAQGVVYKALWRRQVVIYKQMKSTKGKEKKKFAVEFHVWWYAFNLTQFKLMLLTNNFL